MKYFLFASIILVLLVSVARADVYVITAPDKSVYSLSEQDDAVVPSGYTKAVIKGKRIADLALGDVKLYDFSGGNFALNTKRVKDKNEAEEDAALAFEKRDADRNSALNKLKSLGLTDDEITALFK